MSLPPDSAPWQRLEALFDEAVSLTAEDRAAFLEALGPPVRDRLEALLAADARAAGFLQDSADAYLPDLAGSRDADAETPGALQPGRQVGPYRIEREIGHGGMGWVFLAHRADGGFEQRVALKIVRAGMDDEELVGRFLQERQILAGLEHPNIARLVDGGLTADGRPFFAMEYVEGEPITASCDARQLGLDARLDLFLSVCDAVRYAHQRLVVHRDLKPSNTLVAADGRVKLLDFGIATLLQDETRAPMPDRTVWRILTPDYAAPEQVRGERVTTATDVYALGVLLYELVAGRRPWRLRGLTPAEIEEAVCDRAPERPSDAAARAAHEPGGHEAGPPVTPAAIALARDTRPEALRRRLRGDLDAIVLHALHKDPARRYPSVDALVDDLSRYRRGLPVRARPDTTPYRARKFAARHAVGLAASVLVLLSLVGGLVGTAWQARVASREAAKAREVAAFLTSLFAVAHPGESRGASITARELVDRGAARISSDLAGQPAIQAELLNVVGIIYRELGLWEDAEGHLARALELRRGLYRGDHAEVADTLSALANVLIERNELARADPIVAETVSMRRRLFGNRHPAVADALSNAGALRQRQGRLDEAIDATREALEIDRQVHGGQHAAIATDLNNLGVYLNIAGDYAGAEAAHREALTIRQAVLDEGHPDVAETLGNLAIVLSRLGRSDDAERLERDVLAIRTRVYGERHPWVALSLNNLATRLSNLGRYEEAEEMHRHAFAVRREVLGPGHPDTLASLNNTAVAAYRRGDLAAAETAFRGAFEAWSESLGPEHRLTMTGAANVGVVLSDRGRYEEAEVFLSRVLSGRRRQLGSGHPDVGVTLRHLGVLFTRAGRRGEAEAALREALETFRTAFPDAAHPRTAETLLSLAEALARVAPGDAVSHATAGLEMRTALFGASDPRTADAKRVLGEALAAAGRRDDAERLLVESYEGLRTSIDPREGERILRALVAFYRTGGAASEAARYEALLRAR
jgi:eukaryotic-like serine/threonine-protein kinase